MFSDDSSLNEFRIIDKLGEGSFADVYKVRSVKTQLVYAEKRLKKRYRSIDEVNQLLEVSALRLLNGHPNIIHLHALVYDSQSGHVAMLFEIMDMNLYEYLSKKEKCLDEQTALLMIYQLVKAIENVHSKGIFHRDIKPENCLINTETLELKLSDFGSVSPIANRTRFTEYVATRWYRAPECILTSGVYGPSVDIWAIGCVLFEVLTGRPLFPGKQQLDQLNKIHSILGTPSKAILAQFQSDTIDKINFSFPQRQKQPFRNLLPNVSDTVIDLLEKMIAYDPNDRISAKDALQHPAFSYLYQQDLLWQQTSKSIPFSVYVQSPSIPRNPITILPQKPNVLIGAHTQLNFNMPPQNQYPHASTDITGQYSYGGPLNIQQSEYINQNNPIPPLPAPIENNPIPQPRPLIQMQQRPIAKPAINPIDARKLAAERIKDYNKRHLMAQQQQKAKLPGQLGIRFGVTGTNPFQKPRPDLVQTRLPNITYRPIPKM